MLYCEDPSARIDQLELFVERMNGDVRLKRIRWCISNISSSQRLRLKKKSRSRYVRVEIVKATRTAATVACTSDLNRKDYTHIRIAA